MDGDGYFESWVLDNAVDSKKDPIFSLFSLWVYSWNTNENMDKYIRTIDGDTSSVTGNKQMEHKKSNNRQEL